MFNKLAYHEPSGVLFRHYFGGESLRLALIDLGPLRFR